MTKTELKKIKDESPVAEFIERMEAAIERKLNHDGRWLVLNPILSQMRLGTLTNKELEYFGKQRGFGDPFCGGVDWDAASDIFLSECLLLPQKRSMNTLSYAHPSPDRKPVFDAANPEDIADFLAGDITFDELQRYPKQEGK